ncbi:MAG: protease HtpX [Chlamydiia bacterium]|nr:protease HtpX [Chlamydiia bacterium]
MLRRIALFLLINCLVVFTISVVLSLLNVKPYLTRYGLDLTSLMIFCLVWGMVGALISLALSRKMAKWVMRIQEVTPSGPHADLYHLVARLARDANLPAVPEVGIFDSHQMNAFATGPTKRRSLVAVSTGLLSRMEKTELEAVLAHEISHISNGDMVTMTLIQGIVNAFVMFLARVFAYALSSLGRSNNQRSSYMSYYLFTILFEVVFMLLGMMVVCTFSRYREFRADRGGAILTRKESMIAALEKLKTERIAKEKKKSPLNALMISLPEGGVLSLLATHPPLEKRIERLKEL